MPKFDKNLQIKNDILETAKKLFYEKGYDNTTFADIASNLRITKGLISYYFDSKANLANRVYHDFISKNQSTISMKFYTTLRNEFVYNPRVITVVSNLSSYTMFREDENARKFFVEFLFHDFCFSIMNGDYGLWEIHKHAVDKDKLSDKNYLRMLATASRSASSIIQIQYFSGMLDISFEEFADFAIRLKYQIEGLSPEEIDTVIKNGKLVFERLDLHYNPYFELE